MVGGEAKSKKKASGAGVACTLRTKKRTNHTRGTAVFLEGFSQQGILSVAAAAGCAEPQHMPG